MKILVTAFDPFGGEDTNPTAQIISALRGVETLVLPVSFAVAPRIALQKIREVNPDAIILLGQAGGRADISLERVAINIADAIIPDNDGFMPIDTPIYKNGPAAYFCRLPLMEIRDAVRGSGVPCHISNTAGTYVCNTLYYSVMHEFPSLNVIFVHMPYSPHQAVNKKSGVPSMNITDMTAAVQTIISFLISES